MELLLLILFAIFIISIVIQLFFVLYFFVRFLIYKSPDKSFNLPVSIIVCAKNEYDNISKFLTSILEQKYSDFEVILVDDQSQDNSEYVLKELANKYSHLNIVKIEQHIKKRVGKKFALTLGIKAAKNDYLVLTDADCMPSSNNWLSRMVSSFNNKEIVLGYGGYRKKKGLLNLIIRFDTFNIALQYLSFALAGHTYMGVGRNLAYTRATFFNNKGFASHILLPSGDDDLFIQEVATKDNIAIETHNESHTISEPKETWKEWIFQRRRHITTSQKYSLKFKFLLALWPLSQLLFLTTSFILLTYKVSFYVVLPLFIFRLFLFYILYYYSMRKLKSLDLLIWFPILEVIHIILQVIFVLLNFKNKPKGW